MPRQLCETRVEAPGRTIAEPCGTVCTPIDVYWWYRSAKAWIEGAQSVARTPDAVVRVNALRSAFASVAGLPRSMVDQYARLAVSASCLMTVLAHEEAARPRPPGVPPAPPPEKSGWPDLPGLPDIDLPDIDLPDLPKWKWPEFPDAEKLLLIGVILFVGGWLTGEVLE